MVLILFHGSRNAASPFSKGQMQGGERTGPERTVPYVTTGSAATTPL